MSIVQVHQAPPSEQSGLDHSRNSPPKPLAPFSGLGGCLSPSESERVVGVTMGFLKAAEEERDDASSGCPLQQTESLLLGRHGTTSGPRSPTTHERLPSAPLSRWCSELTRRQELKQRGWGLGVGVGLGFGPGATWAHWRSRVRRGLDLEIQIYVPPASPPADRQQPYQSSRPSKKFNHVGEVGPVMKRANTARK